LVHLLCQWWYHLLYELYDDLDLWAIWTCVAYICFSCLPSERVRHLCQFFQTWHGCLTCFHGRHEPSVCAIVVLVIYLVSQQERKLTHAHVFMPGLVVFDVSLVDMNPLPVFIMLQVKVLWNGLIWGCPFLLFP
jgi:hypothetical protein